MSPAAAGPARLAGQLAAFVRRDFREALSYKFSFVSSFAGIFLSSATFYFVAKLVPGGSPALSDFGGDYFSFAIVGVSFSSLLGMFQGGLPAVVRGAQVSGTLEALLVTPASIPTVLFGSSLYSLFFQVFRTLLHLGVALAIFDMDIGRVNVPGVLCVGVLTVLCFLSIGILSASFILVYKTGNPFGWVFGTVSGLLGGVVFPVSLLPPWIGWISRLLPVTYALDGMRKSLLASAGFAEILPSLAALAVFNAVFLPLSVIVFRLAVRKAKKDGTLSHY
jgi:ABC-2 type transport system permease protein